VAADYLIGVDLGTSIVKATLFNAEGRRLADASRAPALRQPEPGLAEQDGDEFHTAALSCIEEVVEKAGLNGSSVAAIAFDGQMAGAMGIDREGKAITPWYPSALDTRYQPYLEEMLKNAGRRLVELTGSLPFAAPRMLWWKKENPDLYNRIYRVVILANYVAGRMAGLPGDEAFIDPSYLTWFGLADSKERAWSVELAGMFDLSADKLPRIVSATSIIGRLSDPAAASCGLIGGIPLIAGTGDQVASCLGAGLVAEGQLIDVAGTFSVLATCMNRFLADTRHGMLHPLAGPVSESQWYPMMYISGGGLTHRWYCEQFCCDDPEAFDATDDSVYRSLDERASKLTPGSEGLLFIPHLVGRACPSEPLMRGTWVGFTWTHRREHFYRAILESIAYDYAQALDVIRDYFPDERFREVRVIGGGASSDLWNQIKADVLGVPYMKLRIRDTAPLGCALMAGHAVGIFPDLAEAARRLTETHGRFEPRKAYHERYAEYAQAYSLALRSLRDVFGVLTPLGTRDFHG
jgi:xylulokinase